MPWSLGDEIDSLLLSIARILGGVCSTLRSAVDRAAQSEDDDRAAPHLAGLCLSIRSRSAGPAVSRLRLTTRRPRCRCRLLAEFQRLDLSLSLPPPGRRLRHGHALGGRLSGLQDARRRDREVAGRVFTVRLGVNDDSQCRCSARSCPKKGSRPGRGNSGAPGAGVLGRCPTASSFPRWAGGPHD